MAFQKQTPVCLWHHYSQGSCSCSVQCSVSPEEQCAVANKYFLMYLKIHLLGLTTLGRCNSFLFTSIFSLYCRFIYNFCVLYCNFIVMSI